MASISILLSKAKYFVKHRFTATTLKYSTIGNLLKKNSNLQDIFLRRSQCSAAAAGSE
jgi:hypothetical protein